MVAAPLALPEAAWPEARLCCAWRIGPRRGGRRRSWRNPAAETVGRLAGGIAHDFNNLLTAILGGAEAARTAGLPAGAEADLAQMEDAARRGAALVRQLLAFARQQHLQRRVVNSTRRWRPSRPCCAACWARPSGWT